MALVINNLPIALKTVTRLPAPPKVPADLLGLVADCEAGFSPMAGSLVAMASKKERRAYIAALIAGELSGY